MMSGKARLAPLSVSRATRMLKADVTELGLIASEWEAFRRGRADDMLATGQPLYELLIDGAWRSISFVQYLAKSRVDERLLLEQMLADSDLGDKRRATRVRDAFGNAKNNIFKS